MVFLNKTKNLAYLWSVENTRGCVGYKILKFLTRELRYQKQNLKESEKENIKIKKTETTYILISKLCFFFCKTFLKQRHFVIIFSVFIHRWLMIVIKFNCFKSSFFSIQFWLANILMFRISSRILMMIVKICRIKTNTFYFSLFQNEKISLSIYHSSTHYYVMNSSLSLFIYFLFDFNFIFFFVDCLRMSIFFKKKDPMNWLWIDQKFTYTLCWEESLLYNCPMSFFSLFFVQK